MIKVSDFIFRYLHEKYGIDQCFLVTGGGAMHLNYSVGHTPGLKYTCNHHEQACAIAAEGYYRTKGKMCVVNVTSGPGGTNALTGVLGQYQDSIPAIYISGQIKTSTYKNCYEGLNLRQLGDQENDIVSMVKPIAKYATTVCDAKEIKYHIDKAVKLALSGRPGPVWLDIPLDVQSAQVDEAALYGMDDAEVDNGVDHALVDKQIAELINKIKNAKSPVIYAGNGIRLAGRTDAFIKLAEKLNIPVVTSISGSDLLWSSHRLHFGKPGICGDRIGNIMVQNSDLLIVLGTRLGIRQIGYAYDKFAPKAYKVMVDIDRNEMLKPTLKIDMPIHAGLDDFIDKFSVAADGAKLPDFSHWREWGRKAEALLPSLIDDNPDCDGYVNSYRFVDGLFEQLKSGDVVVTGNGTAYTCTYQAMKVGEGVRVFANQGCASMGYCLPAAIGAAIANTGGRTVLITGDGSIQMNIQELQTIVTYNLPIKIFVLENEGYLAIKTTQNNYFNGEFVGSNPTSGVVCPDLHKIADAYGIPYISVSENGDTLRNTIAEALNTDGPIICEVHMHPEQTLYPKAASYMDKTTGKMESAPLEMMAPFLPDDIQQQLIY